MYFTASYGAKDTAGSVRKFIQSHKVELWSLVKSVAPVLFIFTIFSMVAEYFMTQNAMAYMQQRAVPKNPAELFEIMRHISLSIYLTPVGWASILLQVLIGYCFAVIAVSWHRIVLLGPDRSEQMNVFAPQKHEVNFVIVWTLLSVVLPHVIALLMNMNLGYVLLSSLLFPYLFFKVSFYFPAKALDSHLSFKHSFILTKGLFFKFALSVFLSFWRIILLLVLFSFIGGFCAAIATKVIFASSDISAYMTGAYRQMINQMLMRFPVTFYFQPIFTVLGVTVLSNYYQYALQNKDEAAHVSI